MNIAVLSIDGVLRILNNTTFTTVLSGTLVFIFGQLFVELFIKPLNKYNSVKSDIIFYLYKYREPILNPISPRNYLNYLKSEKEYENECAHDYKMAQIKGKELASELAKFLENRGICFLIPNRKRIKEAIDNLFWMSECMIKEDNYNTKKDQMESYKNIIISLKLYGIEKWKIK